MSKNPLIEQKAIDIPRLDVTRNLIILTGAGISAESGLKTFRDSGGLWENHRIEDVATPEAFRRDPKRVHDFYNMRRRQLRDTLPNAAHAALAVLERQWEGDFLLITQNVDNLHARAGSKKLVHMHGELTKAICQRTYEIFNWEDDLTISTPCPCCDKPGNLRPHIVWFGEMPLEMERIEAALYDCEIFISIGTSGQVYPAAGFAYEAKMAGAFTLECNLAPSGSPLFDVALYGPATEMVRKLMKSVK